MSTNFDIVIKNGLVIDGTGAAAKQCDIGIIGDKIDFIGKIDTQQCTATIINADGYVVSPGFIDIHSHSDFLWLLHPECNSKVFDGVTTEVCGNCGSSPFPVRGKLLEHRKKGFQNFGLDINWNSANEFFNIAKTTPSSINRAFLVGHGNLRACIMGYDDRKANKSELASMITELSKALLEGALGMSSGTAYPPGCYAQSNEITELCNLVNEYDAIYTTHIRDEGDKVEESLAEVISVSQKTGANLQISHLKTAGKSNWKKLGGIKNLLDSAIAKGVALSCDRYPYTASSTDLDAIFPKWLYEGGIEKEVARLRDFSVRKRLREELTSSICLDDDFWKSIVVSAVLHDQNKMIVGNNIKDISVERKQDPFDAVCDLLIEEDARIDVLFFNMSEENLKNILKWDFVMIGSDSSLRSADGVLNVGNPHPRAYGTFSRVLGRYCRENGLLTLEEAIYKMTGFPASKFCIEKRGLLKADYFADIVIFDREEIRDISAFDQPHRYSQGIKYVIVNGNVTIEDGNHKGTTAGKVLKKAYSTNN